MNTYSNQPNVLVKVNGILAVGKGNSSYVFISQIPVLTVLLLSENILNIELTDPQLLNANLSEISVTVGNDNCINLVGAMVNFTCQLSTYSNGTLRLPVGIYYPVIKIRPIGYLATNSLIFVNVSNITPNINSSNTTTTTNNNTNNTNSNNTISNNTINSTILSSHPV
jgi:hypothetical protein